MEEDTHIVDEEVTREAVEAEEIVMQEDRRSSHVEGLLVMMIEHSVTSFQEG